MIYISSSSIKEKNLIKVLEALRKNKINKIELSGGTDFNKNLEKDLLSYKEKYKIDFRLHNYFPPPEKDFVVNIGSLNNEIYKQSLDHCLGAIRLSKKLKASKYAIHAGFLLDPHIKEIGLGNKINKNIFFDEQKSIQKMKEAWIILMEEAEDKVKLYLENNVISQKNFNNFKSNPFFLTNKSSYLKIKENFKFNILLDLAHLKVSCKSLGLNFEEEASFLFNETDYIHLSGNNSLEDTNYSVLSDESVVNFLKSKDLSKKTFTLEVYEDISKIINDYNFLKNLIENK
tara:strand:+ start:26311 stop:27174 length:864 start_codon:yes stop_codon:yes gene_type:complete